MSPRPKLTALLAAARSENLLRPLDVAFVSWLMRAADVVAGVTDDAVLLLAALASNQHGQGHLRLDLDLLLREPASLGLDTSAGQALMALLHDRARVDLPALLRASGLVADAAAASTVATPLVLDGHGLYLRRAWRNEVLVAEDLRERMRAPVLQDDPAGLRPLLDRLFPPDTARPDTGVDWQKVACALAVRQCFTVITGGPGTGKTTTVVKLLGLLQSLALASGGQPQRIALAAPTGKAAARLNESVAGAVAELPLADAVKVFIPTEVSTVHRLLGARGASRRFRHDAANPLLLDVLVIDEASMLDLELMAAVLAALPASARLILLGDKDQLASVEAGAVLGDLCARAEAGGYTPALAAWLTAMTGADLRPWRLPDAVPAQTLDQHVVMLRHSHRFDAERGIGRLATALQAGQGGAPGLLASCAPEVRPVRREVLLDGYAGFRAALAQQPSAQADAVAWDAWALSLLQVFDRFRILCAVRQGPTGVTGVNAAVEAHLALPSATSPWHVGRPVMVTQNDHALGLMNGDIGLVLPQPDPDGGGMRLRVAFRSTQADAGVRWFLPARLPAHETVYAMTVHKSQGSEFERVGMIFPDGVSPVMTRELLYTALTRAKTSFEPALDSEMPWQQAQLRRSLRASGLAGRLRDITESMI